MMFYSFQAGDKRMELICPKCYNPKRKDLVEAVEKATSDFKEAMQRINDLLAAEKVEKERRPKPLALNRPQQEDNTLAVEHDVRLEEVAEQTNAVYLELARQGRFDGYIDSPEFERSRSTFFEPARTDKFRGFETERINSLLKDIEDAVYNHDREMCYAKDLFTDGKDSSMTNPLKVWDQIDPKHHLISGKQWFDINRELSNLSDGHAPITAALRKMLGIPDDEPLYISPNLKNLSYSEVFMALINWFIFDVLNNEINMYHLPNMKPLRAMMTAVADFGNERWKGSGRQVLREVHLRAWHKPHFGGEVIDNVGWQGELVRRLDDFLKPLTRKVGMIDPWSQTRASIIKHAIELWSYLGAAMGRFETIQPLIGDYFDTRVCENTVDDLQPGRVQDMEVKWVMRRGFVFIEDSADGSTRPLKKKALIIVK